MTRPGGRESPFDVLGLPASREVTDDDVRAAWRRIATASHPDRADGGDPERFAVASAAYTTLRTRYGRGEVLADLTGVGVTAARPAPASPADASPATASPADASPADASSRAPAEPASAARVPDETAPGETALGEIDRGAAPGASARGVFWRIRSGRPGVLAVRVAITATVAAVAVVATGFSPSAFALITGAATWLALTARNDLAPQDPR